MMEYRKWEKGRLRADGAPGFDTPTGKFEIASTILEEHGYEPLPKYTEPRGGPAGAARTSRADFPLVFNSGARPHTDFRSQHHGVPGLLAEQPRADGRAQRATTPRARGIDDGDLVEVRTPRGAVRFRARVTDDIVRGRGRVQHGRRHAGGAPGVAGVRTSTSSPTWSSFDAISGFPVYKALLCDVTRVAGGDGDARRRGRAPHAARRRFAAAARPPPRRRIDLDDNATTARSRPRCARRCCPYLGAGRRQPVEPPRPRARGPRGGRGGARRSVARAHRRTARARSSSPAAARRPTTSRSRASPSRARGGRRPHRHQRHRAPGGARRLPVPRAPGLPGDRTCRVDADGLVAPEALAAALDGRARCWCRSCWRTTRSARSSPSRELCALAHARGALFHTDAVQAAARSRVDVEALGRRPADVSAHKLHGPKGVGALYVRAGHHARAARPRRQPGARAAGGHGERAPASPGCGRAAELAARAPGRGATRLAALRDRLEEGVARSCRARA